MIKPYMLMVAVNFTIIALHTLIIYLVIDIIIPLDIVLYGFNVMINGYLIGWLFEKNRVENKGEK